VTPPPPPACKPIATNVLLRAKVMNLDPPGNVRPALASTALDCAYPTKQQFKRCLSLKFTPRKAPANPNGKIRGKVRSKCKTVKVVSTTWWVGTKVDGKVVWHKAGTRKGGTRVWKSKKFAVPGTEIYGFRWVKVGVRVKGIAL
jgi:hypothetical protein